MSRKGRNRKFKEARGIRRDAPWTVVKKRDIEPHNRDSLIILVAAPQGLTRCLRKMCEGHRHDPWHQGSQTDKDLMPQLGTDVLKPQDLNGSHGLKHLMSLQRQCKIMTSGQKGQGFGTILAKEILP